VKRQSGLTRPKRGGQIADALFSFAQSFQYSEPRLIGEGMEEARRFSSISQHQGRHTKIHTSTLIDLSSREREMQI
jgi:hypothetical protein